MKTFFSIISIFISLNCFSQPLLPQVNSVQIANYQIDAKLDAERKTLEGNLILFWKNPSQDTIKELQFHLYWNAFKNSRSTFLQERGVNDLNINDKDLWGNIEILSLIHFDSTFEENLTSALQFISPDDSNPDDQTVAKVSLKNFIFPEKIAKIKIHFSSKIPKIIARSGFSQDYFLIGQWFPKIGVYEPAGMRFAQKGQWNCHQYHRNSEFYADFGNYLVNISVPQNFVVGATGMLKNEQILGKTKTLTFQADSVIDFAFAASPLFEVFEKNYNDVKIKVLLFPEHEHFAQRYFSAIEKSMNFLSKNLGKYPHPVITLISPPFSGYNSAGMEYPMLVVGEVFVGNPQNFRLLELVTIHEFTHQYFMSLVATNEFEEAWLDEGITTYFETQIMNEYFGEKTSLLEMFGLKIGTFDFQKNLYTFAENPKIAETSLKSWEFSENSYAVLSYYKPLVWLKTLEKNLGSETMDKIFRKYFEKWKFKHPCGEDFIATINETLAESHNEKLGADLNWFFYQVLYGTNICDYKMAKIHDSEIILHRMGEITFPVEILVHFENGKEILEKWDGKSRTKTFRYNEKSAILWAKIDPFQKNFLDINLQNNSLSQENNSAARWKYLVKFLFWTENLLQFVSSIFV